MIPENDNSIEVVPEGWSIRQISDLCENLDNLRRPIARSIRVPGSIPYYGANGVQDYVSGYLFDEELVLVAEDCGDYKHFGKTAYVIRGKSWVNNHAHILRCKKINSVFLKEMLNYLDLTHHINMGSRGKLNKADLEKIPIPLPPPSEQQKIAEILTTIDEEIELTEKILHETEIIKHGLMQKTFEQHGTNAEIVYLGDHTLIKARIGWRGLSASEYTPDGPYLVAGQHISGSRILWDKCDHISDFRYNESSEIQLAPGDVIISKDGTIGRVGYVDILPGRATINGTMMLVRGKNQRVLHPKYLYYYFQGPIFQRLIKEKTSGSSVPHLFQRDMVKLRFPLVSLEKQSEIIDALTSLDNRLEGEKVRTIRLENLKKGLMHDLLSGKVRVS